MFDRLETTLYRMEEVMQLLSSPETAGDPKKLQELMKEQAELQPVTQAYQAYKDAKTAAEESMEMLREEKDPEMRELFKEENAAARAELQELEKKLQILVLPKVTNDQKNVIVEIRAGAGGEEAALFAAELYRMYSRYAETNHWKTEIMTLNESGIGGFKEVTFMIRGAGAYSKLKYESGVHRVQRVPE
ncbi:MAG: PCRF domain-containing protein, partial [Eubacterium sp.]|nr:PCRF domain-containing protein [Eubacterium sp.]